MKCAVLVSGGVDSSVALQLLHEANYQVTAFYIKIWLEDELSFLGDCPWKEDLLYVQAICQKLNIPLEIVSLQREYWDRVVAYTVAEVKAGRTPNPDIMCNQRIKFGAFFDVIGTAFDVIATGHYANVEHINQTAVLLRSPDAIKDQSYFLSYLTQEQLKKILFPLAPYTKSQVRQLAEKFDLPNKSRKDSQGICFLGTIKFDQFIEHHLGHQIGKLIEFETNTIVGTHNGFWFYTIGQRKGIGLSGGPWYVVAKDPEKNYVYISRSYYSNDKMRDTFLVTNCNWINQPPHDQQKLLVKVRHGSQFHHATVHKHDDASWNVMLDQHDQGIAAGQFAAFYDGNICLGSGIIQLHPHS